MVFLLVVVVELIVNSVVNDYCRSSQVKSKRDMLKEMSLDQLELELVTTNVLHDHVLLCIEELNSKE
jgi:hypothetical protein